MEELVRYYIIFTGRVQSVGFRYKAEYLASQNELTGYVKNEYDGTVSMEVQGKAEDIEVFLERLRTDRFIRIFSMSKEKIATIEDEKSFVVKG